MAADLNALTFPELPKSTGLSEHFALKYEKLSAGQTVSNQFVSFCRAAISELKIVEAQIGVVLAYGMQADVESCSSFLKFEGAPIAFSASQEALLALSPDDLQREAEAVAAALFPEIPELQNLFAASVDEAKRFLINFTTPGCLDEAFRRKLGGLIDELHELRAAYDSLAEDRYLFQRDSDPLNHYRRFYRTRDAHRRLFGELAALFESSEWFSPAAYASFWVSKGVYQRDNATMADYGRSLPEPLSVCEAKLAAQRALNAVRSSFHLTGGGMQAFHTAMRVIADVAAETEARPVMAQTGIYWEIDDEISNLSQAPWVSAVQKFTSRTTAELRAQLIEHRPRLLVASPVGNCPEMNATDLRGLLECVAAPAFQTAWSLGCLRDKSRGELIILIDNSTLSNAALWKDFDFSKLPPWCVVGAIESMTKCQQDGFDYAPAGNITWWAGENTVPWLRNRTQSVRTRIGATPTPNTVHKLLLGPSYEFSRTRSLIIAHNNLLLAAELRKLNDFISSCYLSGDVPGVELIVTTFPQTPERPDWPETPAPFFYLRLSEQCVERWTRYLHEKEGRPLDRSEAESAVLQHILDSALLEARCSPTNLTNGTSFGFDNTRISLIHYYDNERNVRAALRIAAGIEDRQGLLNIADVLQSAVAFVRRRMPERSAFAAHKEEKLKFPYSR